MYSDLTHMCIFNFFERQLLQVVNTTMQTLSTYYVLRFVITILNGEKIHAKSPKIVPLTNWNFFLQKALKGSNW
jgi:hypothetical protein